MDIHPTGFPGLVGPEGGSGFNHFDFSSNLRILPNTNSNDIASPNQDSLSLRSHFHTPHLHASPIAVPSALPHPLRLSDDMNSGVSGGHSNPTKISSPRLAASPSHQPRHHLLPSDSASLLPSPRFSPKSVTAPPARISTPENRPDEPDLLLLPLDESSKDIQIRLHEI